MIQLVRSSAESKTISYTKKLDLAPWMKSNVKTVYELNAVILFWPRGVNGTGEAHYTAYVRVDGKWYHADDANVSKLPKKQFTSPPVNSYPCILFYKRVLDAQETTIAQAGTKPTATNLLHEHLQVDNTTNNLTANQGANVTSSNTQTQPGQQDKTLDNTNAVALKANSMVRLYLHSIKRLRLIGFNICRLSRKDGPSTVDHL